jgi:hypothetical protein
MLFAIVQRLIQTKFGELSIRSLNQGRRGKGRDWNDRLSSSGGE